MSAFLTDIKQITLEAIFPTYCLNCHKLGQIVCQNCLEDLKGVEFQMCGVCHTPSLLGLTHPRCQSPFAPDQLLSALSYQDEHTSNLIIKGKYKPFLLEVFTVLGERLITLLQNAQIILDPLNTFITPLPLARGRKRWRGFNQSEIIAQVIAKHFKIRLASLLVRIKPTRVQKDLKREDRFTNIENCFVLQSKPRTQWWSRFIDLSTTPAEPLPNIHGKTIFIVDDVVTTGATLREATKVLKRSGAKTVICLTLAQD